MASGFVASCIYGAGKAMEAVAAEKNLHLVKAFQRIQVHRLNLSAANAVEYAKQLTA